MRIMVVFGTRPEAIKVFPVVQALASCSGIDLSLCVSGQHRDLLDQVLTLTGMRPDVDLDLMTADQSLPGLTAAMLTRLSAVLSDMRPDWVLVQGDTATAMAAALAAFYQRIAVGHIEAGLRSGDLLAPWPEEANRRIVGVLADLHFAPTASAREHLLRAGADPARVHVTGNTVIDALLHFRARLRAEPALRAAAEAALPALDPARRLILVTGHRRESFGGGLERVCQALRVLAARPDVEIVYPVHPNPNVRRAVAAELEGEGRVHLLPPLGYLPFLALMDRCHFLISDSGGVQEEAPALGKPVLVTRETTERREGIEAGSARLVGTDPARILAEATRLLDDPAAYARMSQARNPYGDGRAAARIRDILLSGKVAAGI